jgi:hypothetical protein
MAVSSVNSAASSTTLLAVNTSRDGATIRNTDANILYVLLDGGTASATNHTVALATGDYYELPARYRGQVNGIWAADGSGVALISEF